MNFKSYPNCGQITSNLSIKYSLFQYLLTNGLTSHDNNQILHPKPAIYELNLNTFLLILRLYLHCFCDFSITD